jgi:hypothetical protein
MYQWQACRSLWRESQYQLQCQDGLHVIYYIYHGTNYSRRIIVCRGGWLRQRCKSPEALLLSLVDAGRAAALVLPWGKAACRKRNASPDSRLRHGF